MLIHATATAAALSLMLLLLWNLSLPVQSLMPLHGILCNKVAYHCNVKPSAVIYYHRHHQAPAVWTSRPLCSTVRYASLISPTDSWGIWSVIAASAASSLYLERTKVGRSLSGPVTAMLLTTILTMIGVLPIGGSVHITSLQGFVVKLATPLLLLGADLGEIFRETGSLLRAFLVGTCGTLLGSMLGYSLFASQLQSIGASGDGWKIAGCITAKNIGGGLNFMAVADILKVTPSTISTGLAVDNVVGLVYFPLVSWLGNKYNSNSNNSAIDIGVKEDSLVLPPDKAVDDEYGLQASSADSNRVSNSCSLSDDMRFMSALAIAFVLTALAETVSRMTAVPAIALSSIMTVLVASLLPTQLKPYVSPGELMGKLLLLLFCSSIGSSSGAIFQSMGNSSSGAVALFGYGVTLYVVHFVVIYVLGYLFMQLPIPDLLLGSNANIGNAATASALAVSMGWRSRLLPAILVGNLGNFIGTFGGLWLSTYVFRPMFLKAAGL